MSPSKSKHKKSSSGSPEHLDNLIGRPLVPFFIEGNNGATVENASLQFDKNQSAYEFQDALTVREFKDGYFQHAKVVRGASSLPVSPTKTTKSRHNKQHTGAQRNINGPRHQTPPKARQASRKGGAKQAGGKQTHWAGGAYLNSPSPKLVPLPSFAFAGSMSHNENSSRAANANADSHKTKTKTKTNKTNKNNKNKNKNKKTNNVTHSNPATTQGKQINQNVLSFFNSYNASLDSPSVAFTTPPVRATSVSVGASPLLLGTPVHARAAAAARSLAKEDAGSFLLKLVKGEAEVSQPVESTPPEETRPSPMLFFRGSHGVTSIPIAVS